MSLKTYSNKKKNKSLKATKEYNRNWYIFKLHYTLFYYYYVYLIYTKRTHNTHKDRLNFTVMFMFVFCLINPQMLIIVFFSLIFWVKKKSKGTINLNNSSYIHVLFTRSMDECTLFIYNHINFIFKVVIIVFVQQLPYFKFEV